MGNYTVTITLDAPDRDTARRLVEGAGFTVSKVTAPRTKITTPTTGTVPVGRASALTDMPHGLDDLAAKAYVKGYAKGCMTYTRKHGAPSITGSRGVVVDRVELRRITRAHEWDRHPTAHRAGMRELGRWLERHPADVSAVA